jgi:hypothetical protein
MGNSWNSLFSNYNRVAGIDGHFKFLEYYRFSFQALGSMTKTGTEKTDFVPALNFNLSHNSRHLTFSADWTSIHPEFAASIGFLRRKDIHSLNSRLSYNFLPQTDLIISITPSLEYRRIYDFDQTLTDEEYQFSMFLNGWRQTHGGVSFTSSFERYNGVNFRKREYQANLGSEPLSWLSGNINFSFGDGIYYEDNPYLGYKTSYGLRITLKPLSNLRLFYNIQNDEFYKKKGGEKVYEINIISQRITYQLSRSLSLRLITDYNDYDKKFYGSLLLSYVHRPGTVLFHQILLLVADLRKLSFPRGVRSYHREVKYSWRVLILFTMARPDPHENSFGHRHLFSFGARSSIFLFFFPSWNYHFLCRR